MAGCNAEWFERVSALHDEACGVLERSATEVHLERCPECARARTRLSELSASFRREAARPVTVPERLRRMAPGRRRRHGLRALGAAAALLLIAGGSVGLGTYSPGLGEALAQDLERHHLHAFTRKTPCEFESEDPAAVEAWIAANTPFQVKVPELSGATLLGARRCRLRGELAVSLLYRQGEHPVTVFLPGSGTAAAKAVERLSADGSRCTLGPSGENICAAEQGRVAVAVSDLPEDRLIALTKASAK